MKTNGLIWAGVFVEDINTFENTRWPYFSDPEGNQLVIKEVP